VLKRLAGVDVEEVEARWIDAEPEPLSGLHVHVSVDPGGELRPGFCEQLIVVGRVGYTERGAGEAGRFDREDHVRVGAEALDDADFGVDLQ